MSIDPKLYRKVFGYRGEQFGLGQKRAQQIGLGLNQFWTGSKTSAAIWTRSKRIWSYPNWMCTN